MSDVLSETFDIYTGLLKAFPMPTAEGNDVNFSYIYDHPKYETLKSTYPIEAVAGDGDDFSKAINLLQWVSAHNYHKGDYRGNIPQNALDLLNYSYDKDSSFGINCVGLARILSECLLAIGIQARQVFIMPCSPYDGDNHVVTHVFIKEANKWVMLDPTLNAYVVTQQGEYLSLLELRDLLANQEPIFFNKEAKYNDDVWTEESTKEYTVYFAKNLFYFQASEISTFGSDETSDNRFITLCPQGYNPKQVRLNNIDFRVRKYGDNFYMKKWREGAEKEEYHFCSYTDFEGGR